MATRRLSYRSTSERLDVEHSCDLPPGVSVSGRTTLGASFDLEPGTPFRQTITPPVPEEIQILYLIIGPPLSQYRIDTRISQDTFTNHAVAEGTLPSAGTATHQVTLTPPLVLSDVSEDRPTPSMQDDPEAWYQLQEARRRSEAIRETVEIVRELTDRGDMDAAFSALEKLGQHRAVESVRRHVEKTAQRAPESQPPATPPPSASAPQSVPPPAAAAPGSAPSRSGGTRSTASRRADRPPRVGNGRYTVWFGTNRAPVYEGRSLTGFSSDRSDTVHYGWCRVAIPESHTIGSIGSSWLKRLIARKDDRLKLLTLTTLADAAYWDAVAAALRARQPDERDAVVFVHGYNVSFHDAALRAAQLGFDLGVSGVMAFYSWPSKGTLHGYPADEATIEASEGFISDFLTHMAGRSGARRVHIIAHSMGNRGVLRAIDRIAAAAARRTHTPFDQIILAAADVDQDTFKRLSVAYLSVARRTTMYVCSKDRAVEASHWLHDFPRAGLTPPVLVVPGIDTINVSNLDLTLLGHGYVAEARELLSDIHALLRDGTAPAQRFGLRKMTSPAGDYWLVGK